MENEIKNEVTEIDQTSGEQNSVFILESRSVNTLMEITNTELDQSTVDTEANNQQSVEISPDLGENRENGMEQFLFAPFNHSMRPDPELVRFELEKSALDQEAATKVINDRYKLIMEMSARRKEKEQRDKLKFTQISNNATHEDLLNTIQLSHAACGDINRTTQLLHNLHITPDSVTKDQSEEFSDTQLETIYWHNGLNRFIGLNYTEINTTANISSNDMLTTLTEHHENRVEDALSHMRNEQKDGVQKVTFYQAARKLGIVKRKKAGKIFCDENELIGSSFEELLNKRHKSIYEI